MKKQLETVKAVASATYKEWAAYRSHSLVSLFVGPIFLFIQMFIWKAAFSGKANVAGLSLDQVITYYAFAILLNYIIMDFADWNLQMLIHTGKFLPFMLKPLSHMYFALYQKIGHRLLGLLFEFLPVSLILILVFKVRFHTPYMLYSLISIIFAFLIMFFINYSIGVIGFWLVKTSGVRRVFLFLRDLSSGLFIPLAFFPGVFQKILFFLPFQFITYVPARIFLGSYELGGIRLDIPSVLGVQFIYVLVLWLITTLLLRMGVSKFTGVGA